MLLSVVVPCYNEEKNVHMFYDEVVKAFGDLMNKTELIFINDGSNDQTLKNLKEVYATSPYHIQIVDFSRNFGKEAALLAGFQNSHGDYVAVIDADLQQRPEYVVKMLEILKNHPEYDSVAAYQNKRKEGKIQIFFKDCFYQLINQITDVELVHSASDFRVLKRKVVEAIISLPEKCRFSKGIFSWVGFNTCYIPYTVEKRATGQSKWSFFQLVTYAIDGIVAFSTAPLVLSSVLGMLLFVISMICFLIIVIKTLIWGDPVAGFPTLASLILLLAGIQLLCIGVVGQYLAKNYTESKNRPVYIIKDIYKDGDNHENK